MKIKKQCHNHISNIYWFLILIILGSITLTVYFNNLIIISFIIVSASLLFILKLNKKQYILVISLIILVILFSFIIDHHWNFKTLFNLINNEWINNPRTLAINHINHLYDKQTSEFLNILLFNEKTNKSEIVSNINNLNIIHLFVVSGLHINLLNIFLNFIFRKNKFLNISINMSLMAFIFFLSKFSISILRVIINFIVKLCIKDNNGFKSNSITGIIINILFINEIHNYGYLLSIICSLFITFINLFVKSKIVLFLIINFFTAIIVIPIVNIFNHRINLLYFINNMLLSNIILFLYFFSFIFWPMNFMIDCIKWIINIIIILFNKLLSSQTVINFEFINWFKYIWYHSLIIIGYYFLIKNIEYKNKFNSIVLKLTLIKNKLINIK